MSPSAAAQLLMTLLYSNRFFPKYAYCILVGIQNGMAFLPLYPLSFKFLSWSSLLNPIILIPTKNQSTGKGILFSYDPIGSYGKEGERSSASGSASSLIVPFLDNQVEFKNQYVPYSFDEEKPVVPLSLDKVTKLVKDAFTSATERHIEVGDGLQIVTVYKDGTVVENIYDLKKD